MTLVSRWRELRDARFTPAAVAIAAGLPSLGNGLVLDDAILRENADFRTLPGLARLVSGPTIRPDTEPGASPIYRPLSAAADWLSWQLLRANAPAQHAIEIALHAIVSMLIARVLLDHGVRKGTAATAAILFAAHPAAGLAVAPVGGRGLLLGFASLLFAIHQVRRLTADPKRGVATCLAVGLAATLACVLCHEAFVVAPVALGLVAMTSRVPAVKTSSRGLAVVLGGAIAFGIIALLPAWTPPRADLHRVAEAAAHIVSSSAITAMLPLETSSFVGVSPLGATAAAAVIIIAAVTAMAPAAVLDRKGEGDQATGVAACGGAIAMGGALALAPAAARCGFSSDAHVHLLLGGAVLALAPCAELAAARLSLRARSYAATATMGIALTSIPLAWSGIATWKNETALLHATVAAGAPDVDPEARLARALLASDAGDVATSTPQCIAYASSHPRSTRAHACASRGLLAQGRLEEALAYARAYAADRPHLERARRTLLAALFAAGHIDEARTLVDDRMRTERGP